MLHYIPSLQPHIAILDSSYVCQKKPTGITRSAATAACTVEFSQHPVFTPQHRRRYLGRRCADWFTAYNTAHATQYTITEQAYPNTPYPWENYPYDYWNIWVNPQADETAKSQASLDTLTKDYDVIIFKHCFPVSSIAADTNAASVSSSVKSIENYQLQYATLKTKLRSYPDTKFILWTGAALTQATDSGELARSRQFFTWVKTAWDESDDNIYLWDFYELETEGGNFLLDKYATSASDAHPNSTFAATVAPYFAQRVVNVIRGENLSDLTCKP